MAIVQIHYNVITSGMNVPTRTTIDLELDEAAREVAYETFDIRDLSLPPGQTQVSVSREFPIDRPTVVLGAVPRMHVLGKAMQLDATGASGRSCLASFNHWDFYRQQLFVYETPRDLRAGDKLGLSCFYTTQGRSAPTPNGEDIDDEQCMISLLVPAAGGAPLR
jgi:hypothetical protein